MGYRRDQYRQHIANACARIVINFTNKSGILSAGIASKKESGEMKVSQMIAKLSKLPLHYDIFCEGDAGLYIPAISKETNSVLLYPDYAAMEKSFEAEWKKMKKGQ